MPKPLERPPEEWKSAGEPMTDSQASFLKRLSADAGQEFDPSLSKAAASRRIDELLTRGKGESARTSPTRRTPKAAASRPPKAKREGGMSEAQSAYQKELAVEEGGGEATLIQGDVSVDGRAEEIVKAALAFGGGRLDILVNNAGITRDNLLVRMSAEDWDAVVDLNLRGAFLVTKAAMRPMMKQRSGRIVNVSSVAGVAGNAGQANYASAKAGLIGFTRTVAREMAVRNITCNAVAPGFVPTDLTNALLKQMEETILKQIPLGRFGTVDDVANAIAFLVSDEASYITGQVLVVDGGMVTA